MHTGLSCGLFLELKNFQKLSCISSRGECSTPSMGSGEVDTCINQMSMCSTAKQHGCLPLMGFGQIKSTAPTRIVKRSLKRAHKRIKLNGWTWYRGRMITQSPNVPDEMSKPVESHKASMKSQPHEHKPRNRLVTFSWNGGFLNSSDTTS